VDLNEHSKRVLSAINQGVYRQSQIVKKTCLGPDQVLNALKILRKNKLVEKINGEYRSQNVEK
jgi:predicted transcriptional regulator